MNNLEKNYIKDWRKRTNNPKTESVNLKGVHLKIPNGVFNPSNEVTFSSSFLLENIPADLSGKKVLDMGTGSGIIAIKSELNNARYVVAIDVHKKSVKTAIENSHLNNCNNIAFIWSDLFDKCLGGKFDFIFANLPILEEEFEDLEDLYGRLLNYYENFLTEKGELWVVYASFGDMEMAEKKFKDHPNSIKDNVLTTNKLGVDWYIYKFTK